VSSARPKRQRDSRITVVKGRRVLTFECLRLLLIMGVGICELVIVVRKDVWEDSGCAFESGRVLCDRRYIP